MTHPSRKTRSSSHRRLRPRGAQPDDYLEAFLDLFPPRVVQRIARESDFVQRHRKLDPVAFLYTLAFETGPQLSRTLEALPISYNKRTPDPILSAGGFYERFTPQLVEFLRQCVAYGLTRLRAAPGNRLTPKLARFTDLLIQDSTVIRLFAALAKFYPPDPARQEHEVETHRGRQGRHAVQRPGQRPGASRALPREHLRYRHAEDRPLGEGVDRPHRPRVLQAPGVRPHRGERGVLPLAAEGERPPDLDWIASRPSGSRHRVGGEALVRGRSPPPARGVGRGSGAVVPTTGVSGEA